LTNGRLDISNLELTTTGAAFSNDGTLRLHGTQTLPGLVMDTDSGTIEHYGTGNFTSFNTGYNYYSLKLNNTASTWTLPSALDANGSLIITAGALVANGKNITVGGNWSNSGTFTAGSGTVTLDGNSLQDVTVGGQDSAFNNLTITNNSADGVRILDALYTASLVAANSGSGVQKMRFGAGLTHTVTDNFNVHGSSGHLIQLYSTSEGTRWIIDPQNTISFSYLDVKDSEITTLVKNKTSKDSGNNVNWDFTEHLGFSRFSGNVVLGSGFSFEVASYDLYGNAAGCYSGTLTLETTDSQAQIPNGSGYSVTSYGVRTFSPGACFRTPGNQSLTVTDTVDPLLTVTIFFTVKAPPDYNPPDNDTDSSINNHPRDIEIALGESLVGEEEEKLKRSHYAKGKYKTVVVVLEGKVVATPYDENGLKEDKSATLTAGDNTIQEGEVQ
jgi:hypothetical protein